MLTKHQRRYKIAIITILIGLLSACGTPNYSTISYNSIRDFQDDTSKDLKYSTPSIEYNDKKIHLTFKLILVDGLAKKFAQTKDDIYFKIVVGEVLTKSVDFENYAFIKIDKNSLKNSEVYECDITIPLTRELTQDEIIEYSDPIKYSIYLLDGDFNNVNAFIGMDIKLENQFK